MKIDVSINTMANNHNIWPKSGDLGCGVTANIPCR